jgi:glyoxylase-like metal-dependent hydrolase (beta-lactamase superfamily II)
MTFEPAQQIAPGVFLVDTGYQRPHLAACYVVRGRDSAAIVETGSFQTVPRLLAALAQLGVARDAVSHVIVTHVHLDHAGGAGALMRELPKATLVAHPRGARHLIDPAKLWAGTVAVYGEAETLAMYGAPVPVPAARVVEAPDGFTLDLGERRLRFVDAPGHAKHHFVVLDEATRGFFSGDSFGLSYRETDGGPNGPFFFISTTPVQFDPEALHATLDRMLAERPERLYLTHYGLVEGNLPTHGAALHRGIDAHVAAARAAPAGPGRHAAIKAALTVQLLDGLARHGSPLAPGKALEVFAGDLELNAQGLGFWLDAQPRG